MSGKIFVIQDNGLQSLTEQEFDTEDDFQSLLEKYPDLIPGEQINEAAPRRWLLVAREYGVPDEEGAADRWALDHLFLDQDAIPTLVEVKRRSDARLTGARREVVGQMLDYAANAVVYWPVETIRARFESGCDARGEDAGQLIENFIGSSTAEDVVESFWNRVQTNLQAGRIRLIFVADHIPTELRRIVEFLNLHMNLVEVLAVEIRHFAGVDARGNVLKTLVPRVIGVTSQKPPTTPRPPSTFFEDLIEKRGQAEADVARQIFDWSKSQNLSVRWGKGAIYGSFYILLNYRDREYTLTSLWTNGWIETQFCRLKALAPFDSLPLREELLAKLNAIPEVKLPPDSMTDAEDLRCRLWIRTKSSTSFFMSWNGACKRSKRINDNSNLPTHRWNISTASTHRRAVRD